MTFIDILTGLIIFSIFIFGFSQAFLPVFNAWEYAAKEYQTANSIHFISESFVKECARKEPSIESWEKAAAIVKELENYEITELLKDDILIALKLTCTISGENFEIIGACIP